MPTYNYGMAAAYYKDIIHLIGGFNGFRIGQGLLEYNISNALSPWSYNSTFFSIPLHTYGQWYTQINHILYMAQYPTVNTFNLITKQCNDETLSISAFSAQYSCVCSDPENEVIYYVGGNTTSSYHRDVSISQSLWRLGPDMNVPRWDHSCIVSNNKLYAITGLNEKSQRLESIEYVSTINLHWTTHAWIYADNLTQPMSGTCAVAYNDEIYIIPGYHYEDSEWVYSRKAHILSALTNTVTISNHWLVTQHFQATAAVVLSGAGVIYAFGGQDNLWQFYNITATTANDPTMEPTMEPTALLTTDPTTILSTQYLSDYTDQSTISAISDDETLIGSTDAIQDGEVKGTKSTQWIVLDRGNNSSVFNDIWIIIIILGSILILCVIVSFILIAMAKKNKKKAMSTKHNNKHLDLNPASSSYNQVSSNRFSCKIEKNSGSIATKNNAYEDGNVDTDEGIHQDHNEKQTKYQINVGSETFGQTKNGCEYALPDRPRITNGNNTEEKHVDESKIALPITTRGITEDYRIVFRRTTDGEKHIGDV